MAWQMRLEAAADRRGQTVWRRRNRGPRQSGWRSEACADITVVTVTFVTLRNGVLYRATVKDRASGEVLNWRLSKTKHADVHAYAANEAVARYGPTGFMGEIMKTDQGSQFAGADWITTLSEAGDVSRRMDVSDPKTTSP
ncbi:MAG: DDE-type integrase/transposase/recombinase [Pseudomonadota bacterium]